MMTSRERVRAAIRHQNPDRVPTAYGAVACVTEKLMKCYGFSEYSQLIDKFHIDIVSVEPCYIGPELKRYINSKGEEVKESYWGYETTMHKTETDVYPVVSYYPLSGIESKSDAEKFIVPDPDWFDYKSIKEQCCKYPDKAIITGHEGPFQQVTCLMNMEEFFVLMLEEPEVAKYILDKMVAFELEYYKRIFEAAEGRIDILRPHDDYGTQLSLLFSVDMWREFFEENTKKLVDLAHQYDVFYQQHSCGAVRELIPELIKCKVDVLEPIQKVKGLEPEELYSEFGGKIAFHGGIDTQYLLPFGTAEEVKEEVKYFMKTLNRNGGYILMASQAFESDVPLENIEALYNAPRSFGIEA